jgi:hypothetical protein
MTSLTLVREPLATALRGRPEERPLRDDETVSGLRAELADLLYTCGATREHPLRIGASTLRGTYPSGASELGRLRGLYVGAALRLLVNNTPLSDPFADLTRALERLDPLDPVLNAVRALSDDDRARLASDVRAHVSVLQRELGTVSTQWRPRTQVRSSIVLAGGALELRDHVDLVLGSAHTPLASLTLLDVTTALLDEAAERVMRYHALVACLRTGSVPLRAAMLSSATGERWIVDVTPELLHRSVRDLADVLTTARVAA